MMKISSAKKKSSGAEVSEDEIDYVDKATNRINPTILYSDQAKLEEAKHQLEIDR